MSASLPVAGKPAMTKASAPKAATSAKASAKRTKPAGVPPVDLATASGAPVVEAGRRLERALGGQIRALRRERDLSVADLAAAADISIGMMSKIENGQISPSLSTVQAVATALHVPFTTLFSTFEEKRDCSFVAKGKGMNLERRGTKAGHIYELLGAVVGTDVTMEPYLITLEDTAAPYTGFRHAGVELIYMLSGEVVYRHAGKSYPMKPGDTLVFDSGALHGPEQIARAPATYLSIIVYPRTSTT